MKKIFSLLFLLAISQCIWAQKDTIPRFGSNQGQTYTSSGVTYVYYNYPTQPAPVAITPNASQTSVRINNVTGDLQIVLTNTSSRLGDQIIICFNSDSVQHNISGSGIDFSRYFPNGTFQCRYFCGIFFFVVDETGARIFVHNDTQRLSGSESAAVCNYSAGFGAMNALNGSSNNTNVGINAGGNMVPSSFRNSNFGCNAGTGITSGDDNIFVGYNAGNTGNFSRVTLIGTAINATASDQTILGNGGQVYFGVPTGLSGSGINLVLQTTNRTGTTQSGLNVTLSGAGGTGTGLPGAVIIRTYDTSGVSSTTPQVATEKMRILGESGNVGIGTTSPITKLHIVGQPTFVTGNEGTGKILVSDASGTGDWVTPITGVSGVYQPAYTSGANTDTVFSDTLQYMQLGDVVTVSGQLTINVTSASTVTDFTMSVPISSTFTVPNDAGGTGFCNDVFGYGMAFQAKTGGSLIQVLSISSTETDDRLIDFSFTYRVK